MLELEQKVTNPHRNDIREHQRGKSISHSNAPPKFIRSHSPAYRGFLWSREAPLKGTAGNLRHVPRLPAVSSGCSRHSKQYFLTRMNDLRGLRNSSPNIRSESLGLMTGFSRFHPPQIITPSRPSLAPTAENKYPLA